MNGADVELLRAAPRPWTALQRLQGAVLQSALDDLRRSGSARDAALAWLASDDESDAFAFVGICDALGLDVAAVRRAVAARQVRRLPRRWFAALERACPWAIGDWQQYGERSYGETYAQALEATGLDYSTLKQRRLVAANIQMGCRHPILSFDHHRVVWGMPPAEQDTWLARAEKHRWNRHEFRRRVGRAKAAAKLPAAPSRVTEAFHLHVSTVVALRDALPAESIDAIVTDPPYGEEHLDCFDALGLDVEAVRCAVAARQVRLPPPRWSKP